MIQSKYKFNVEISAQAGKLAYKLRSKRKDMFLNIAIPIALVIMTCLLIYDITHDVNYALDIVLLGLLVAIEIMNLIMPIFIFKSQKKYLTQMEALESDYQISEYDKGVFKEKIYKDNKMLYLNEMSLDKLINYTEFEHYIVLIFNNFATLIFDTDAFEFGGKDELIKLCEKAKSVNSLKKKKK